MPGEEPAAVTARPSGVRVTMYRRIAVGSIIVSVAAAMTGCASSRPAVEGMPSLRAEGVSRATPSADAPVEAVARGIAAFGYELGKDGAEPTRNWVVSPASIAYAFAMARAGAAGKTGAEIDRVFGFPSDGVHEAFNAITRQIVTADVPPARQPGATRQAGPSQPPVVCVGNALFPQRGFGVGDQFLRTLAEQYGVGVNPVDFSSPSAKETIDAWVRRQTAERIQQLFSDLPARTRLVLANTVYLKADWTHPFGSDPTTEDTFHRADGSTTGVPMMHQQAELRYAAGPGWQAVELPMAGDDLAMWILVPSGKGQPHDLLSPDTMAAVAGGLSAQQVDLSIPRWDFGSDVDLVAQLTRLGLSSAFSPGADFSGISPDLYIEQAVHRANITVDEWGTEAAAVTGLSFVDSAPPQPTARVRADRPFAFAVIHGPTKVPLFVGHVADPSAHP